MRLGANAAQRSERIPLERPLLIEWRLPPPAVAELADDPFLVPSFLNLSKTRADCVMQRFMGKDVDEDLPPRDRPRKGVHLPEVDRRCTSVFAEIRVRRTERDGEAQELAPF